MNKVYSILLIAGFLLVIILPLGGMIGNQSQEISEKEKRRLAPLPELNFSSDLLQKFPQEYTEFFDDHYGFRSEMIEVNKGIKRSVFNKSAMKMVVRGEGGWLFLDDRKSLYDHVGLVTLDESVLSGWQQNLLDKQEWLAQRGIQYLFVPVPNKMTIYPEHMPARVRRLAGKTMLDQFINYMNQQQKFYAYVNLKPLFLKHKANGDQLYYYTDSHWNSQGAFLAYQQVMKRLQKWVPQIESSLAYQDLQGRHTERKTDLNAIFGEGDGLPEEEHLLEVKTPCAAAETEQVAEFANTYALKKGKKKKLPWTNGCSNKNLTALVIRDSFGTHIEPFLSESFKRVVYMHPYDRLGMQSFVDIAQFIDQEKPDVYIDIRVERNVKYHLKPDVLLQGALR